MSDLKKKFVKLTETDNLVVRIADLLGDERRELRAFLALKRWTTSDNPNVLTKDFDIMHSVIVFEAYTVKRYDFIMPH